MNFIKDNNTLLRAKAEIGRGKSVVINKYQDRVYVHLFGAKGKHVALYLEEFMNLVGLKDEVEEACSLFQVEEQARAKSEDEARRQAEALVNNVKAEMAKHVSGESQKKRRRRIIED